MLYATTRSNLETYTAYHALTENRAPDGGHYIPLRLGTFSQEELNGLKGKNPNQAVADMLNLLFPTQLTGWDVDFAVGRYPVRLKSMNHRITVAESWHNLDWDFDRMVRNLSALIRGTRDTDKPAGDWAAIAVRMGVLFGVFGELMRDGTAGPETPVDIAVPSGDFSMVMSAWYARCMGLPIGNIVCCCNENNGLWDLIYHGELRTNAVAQRTSTPDCDRVVPDQLERLIFACGGGEETEAFTRCCREGRMYFPPEETLAKLRSGLHVSVVSRKRLESTIPNAYSTHGYVFGPYSALCYAGLLDYRARTGESGNALILSEQGALCHDGMVARCMGMDVERLHKILE